jgi:hypothetical protein
LEALRQAFEVITSAPNDAEYNSKSGTNPLELLESLVTAFIDKLWSYGNRRCFEGQQQRIKKLQDMKECIFLIYLNF